jgi:hypothetical protein
MSEPHPTAAEIEAEARRHYENGRKKVGGRPKWENLNMNDPYDMGMRQHAIEEAKASLLGPLSKV